ncbi:MAG: hypothetical protein JEZ07_02475 [Phycisphaerae bacterium]|nr:hypothetical protein [Phycisphaerae bacterium]
MNNLKKIIILIAIAVLASNSWAGVYFANSYEQAFQAAKKHNSIVIVLVHGSDWNVKGQKIYTSLFKTKTINRSSVKDNVVFTDVDILQSPSEFQKTNNDQRNKGFKPQGIHSYPAICSYLPDGTLLAVKQGQDVPTEVIKVNKTVITLIEDSAKYQNLKATADKANKAKDTKAELAALTELAQLPLNQPKDILKRIKELDPADTDGLQARLSFPHWQKLFADTTSRTQKGQGPEVEKELNEMLKNKVYTKEQLATIHVAIGICHRHQAGHEAQAAVAFQQAAQIAPGTFPAEVGTRCYEAWYKKTK